MKKFINPNWKELRKLDASLKQAWFYIWDQADAIGVYTYDPDYLAVDLAVKISFDDLLKLPKTQKIAPDKILLLDFIEVNYGSLKHDYNPHKPAFRALDANQLYLNSSLNQACPKLEDEDEDKDEDEGKGEDEKKERPKKICFQKPSLDEVTKFMTEVNMVAGGKWDQSKVQITAKAFFNYYESNGWQVGRTSMKNWQAAARNWMNREHINNKTQTNGKTTSSREPLDAAKIAAKHFGITLPHDPKPSEDPQEQSGGSGYADYQLVD